MRRTSSMLVRVQKARVPSALRKWTRPSCASGEPCHRGGHQRLLDSVSHMDAEFSPTGSRQEIPATGRKFLKAGYMEEGERFCDGGRHAARRTHLGPSSRTSSPLRARSLDGGEGQGGEPGIRRDGAVCGRLRHLRAVQDDASRILAGLRERPQIRARTGGGEDGASSSAGMPNECGGERRASPSPSTSSASRTTSAKTRGERSRSGERQAQEAERELRK